MKKIVVLSMTGILLIALSVTAGASDELEVSGSLQSDLIYNSDSKELNDQAAINLILERDFGFGANMYLDLELTGSHNQTAETKIAAAYLNYYTKNMDWRLGKQKINWGSAYKLQPTDYFNPYDFTKLKPLDNKLGVKAVKGIYYGKQGLEVTGVIIPFFKSNELPNEEEQMTNLAADIVGTMPGITLDSNAPYTGLQVKDKLENVQAGFKVTKRAYQGFDLSASLYQGCDQQPLVDLNATRKTVDPAQGDNQATVNFVYPENTRVGIDIIGDITDYEIGWWTEAVYSSYQNEQFGKRWQIAAGLDYTFANNLYLVGQAYYQQGRIAEEADSKLVSLHFDQPVLDFHSWESTLKYDWAAEVYVIDAQFNYSLADAVELQLGASYVNENNSNEGNLLTMAAEDRAYSTLRVDF